MGRSDDRSKSDRDTRNKGSTGQTGGQPGGGVPSGLRGQSQGQSQGQNQGQNQGRPGGFAQGSDTGGSERDLGQGDAVRGQGERGPERRDR